MILLLSSSGDASVDLVIAWLKTFKHPYKRINADDMLTGNFALSLSRKELYLNGTCLPLDEVNAIWHRKFGRFGRTPYYQQARDKMSATDLQQISREYNAALDGISSLMRGKNWLTAPWLTRLNKMDMLNRAQEAGLCIPDTFIVSSRQMIAQKTAEVGPVIVKSVYEPYFIKRSDGYYSMFTKQVETDDMVNLPPHFFPSLVQKKIPKQYELRVFYLDGRFFTMAIFSQRNKMTALDFRKYDWANPNRRVPYQLPPDIEKKLDKMLRRMKLNCCSVDLIRSSEDNQYYFLEINPTGEFGMLSVPCNYDLYRQIALKLIEMDTPGTACAEEKQFMQHDEVH